MNEEEILIAAAKEAEKYDATVKNTLKRPKLIAPILKYAIEEYADMDAGEIAELFTDVSDAVPVDAVSAMAAFRDTEQASLSDKLIRYDIHLRAARPEKDAGGVTVYLYVDLEVQNQYTKEELGYPLLKRALYYVARELSGQLGVLTEQTDYGVLQKSYSIWVCGGVPAELGNTVTRYRITKEDVVGSVPDDAENYDLLEVVFIRRGADRELEGVLDYLQGFFTGDIDRMEKHVRIRDDEELKEEVKAMGGLGAMIARENLAKGWKDGRKDGQNELVKAVGLLRQGMSDEEILSKGIDEGTLALAKGIR